MLSSENETKPFRCGFVALIGKPNVGKSTLMNALIGQKVSIVSNKAQTTRRRILGILTQENFQVIFADTPGVHKAHTRLGKLLNEVAEQAMDTDLLLIVADVHKKPDEEDRAIAQLMASTGWLDSVKGKAKPEVFLCLNKMDMLKAIDVVDHVEAYCKLFGTEQYMLTSLRKIANVEKVLAMVVEKLPEGPALYDEDDITDQPMRLLAAEIIREQALIRTKQEVPHAVATRVDDWTDEPGLTRIAATIVVEKSGQKAIMIGKGGSMLQLIGSSARLQLEEMLGRKVFLELFVKVEPDWRQSPRLLRDLEYME